MNVDRHWYRSRLTFLTFLLLPLSLLFRACVALRRFLFHVHVKKSYRAPCLVIVVGNIAVGGTGKTPMVIWLANLLRVKGYKPGIVSRGYGGKITTGVVAIQPNSDPYEVGDEVVLLAKRTDCPVVVGRDRAAAVKYLLANSDCNVVISDDGLQHYRLDRDIEIVLVDGERQFGNGYLLPAGPLREPLSRLQEVDFVVMQQAHASRNTMVLRGTQLVHLIDQKTIALTEFDNKTVHAVAGIGNPSRFFTALRSVGLEIIEHVFPDHHAYKKEDLSFNDDYPIIMTEKDAVKCKSFVDKRFWYLPVVAEVDDVFTAALLKKIEEKIKCD